MKMVNTYYNMEIDILENYITVISVENPIAYAKIIGDMWKQVNGEEGSFILSDAGKVKSISKEMECIFNPFSLDCNSKKITTRLYQELKIQADSSLQEESLRLNSGIIEYLDKLTMAVPYNVKYNLDMDISGILKIYDVGIDGEGQSLLERIVEYIKIVSRLCGNTLFVFVGLKHYLTDNELKELYKTVFYEKVNLVIIEPSHTKNLDEEKCWIIDKDLCIINL